METQTYNPTEMYAIVAILVTFWSMPLYVAITRRSRPLTVAWLITGKAVFTFGLSWFRAWRVATAEPAPRWTDRPDWETHPWHDAPTSTRGHRRTGSSAA